MLRIYKTEPGAKLVKLKNIKSVSKAWFNLIDPAGKEIEQVSTMLKVDSDILHNALDADERSRVEFDEGILSAIVNLPLLDEEGIFDTLPCGLVFTGQNFLTICSRDNRILSSFNKNTAKTFDTRNRTRFMLSILYKTTQFYLRYLAIINRKTEHIEDSLKQTTHNEELFQLMDIQKSLVYFTTALRDNQLMLEKLLRMTKSPATTKLLAFTEDDVDLLEDVIVENKQAIEMVDMHRSILEGMMDGFASIINNNLNQIMKFLAAITIVLSIPTMLGTFWGMNVAVPFAAHPFGFGIVIALSLLATLIVIIFFRKKGMF
ncbi:MAG: magnesium transporter CorA family protein [Alphaproteobacteria bacterium]|nr:magnesium transporter CorA family protein [Alphaproteobacteria bacterium]